MAAGHCSRGPERVAGGQADAEVDAVGDGRPAVGGEDDRPVPPGGEVGQRVLARPGDQGADARLLGVGHQRRPALAAHEDDERGQQAEPGQHADHGADPAGRRDQDRPGQRAAAVEGQGAQLAQHPGGPAPRCDERARHHGDEQQGDAEGDHQPDGEGEQRRADPAGRAPGVELAPVQDQARGEPAEHGEVHREPGQQRQGRALPRLRRGPDQADDAHHVPQQRQPAEHQRDHPRGLLPPRQPAGQDQQEDGEAHGGAVDGQHERGVDVDEQVGPADAGGQRLEAQHHRAEDQQPRDHRGEAGPAPAGAERPPRTPRRRGRPGRRDRGDHRRAAHPATVAERSAPAPHRATGGRSGWTGRGRVGDGSGGTGWVGRGAGGSAGAGVSRPGRRAAARRARDPRRARRPRPPAPAPGRARPWPAPARCSPSGSACAAAAGSGSRARTAQRCASWSTGTGRTARPVSPAPSQPPSAATRSRTVADPAPPAPARRGR